MHVTNRDSRKTVHRLIWGPAALEEDHSILYYIINPFCSLNQPLEYKFLNAPFFYPVHKLISISLRRAHLPLKWTDMKSDQLMMNSIMILKGSKCWQQHKVRNNLKSMVNLVTTSAGLWFYHYKTAYTESLLLCGSTQVQGVTKVGSQSKNGKNSLSHICRWTCRYAANKSQKPEKNSSFSPSVTSLLVAVNSSPLSVLSYVICSTKTVLAE